MLTADVCIATGYYIVVKARTADRVKGAAGSRGVGPRDDGIVNVVQLVRKGAGQVDFREAAPSATAASGDISRLPVAVNVIARNGGGWSGLRWYSWSSGEAVVGLSVKCGGLQISYGDTND